MPSPASVQEALALLQQNVALLEKTLGSLPGEAPADPAADHSLARGLIRRIDQLEDLMAEGERALPGLAARLRPLHASLLNLLREHSIEPYTVRRGQPLDPETRRRVTVIGSVPKGDGMPEVAEVVRRGYQRNCDRDTRPALILRPAEVRARSRPR